MANELQTENVEDPLTGLVDYDHTPEAEPMVETDDQMFNHNQDVNESSEEFPTMNGLEFQSKDSIELKKQTLKEGHADLNGSTEDANTSYDSLSEVISALENESKNQETEMQSINEALQDQMEGLTDIESPVKTTNEVTVVENPLNDAAKEDNDSESPLSGTQSEVDAGPQIESFDEDFLKSVENQNSNDNTTEDEGEKEQTSTEGIDGGQNLTSGQERNLNSEDKQDNETTEKVDHMDQSERSAMDSISKSTDEISPDENSVEEANDMGENKAENQDGVKKERKDSDEEDMEVNESQNEVDKDDEADEDDDECELDLSLSQISERTKLVQFLTRDSDDEDLDTISPRKKIPKIIEEDDDYEDEDDEDYDPNNEEEQELDLSMKTKKKLDEKVAAKIKQGKLVKQEPEEDGEEETGPEPIDFSFVPSKARGGSNLIIGGYRFKRNRTTPRAVYFKCVHVECKCHVTTDPDVTVIIRNQDSHTHDPDLQQIEEQKFRQQLFDKIDADPNLAPRDLYTSVVQSWELHNDFLPPEYNKIRSSLHRRRNMLLAPLKDPDAELRNPVVCTFLSRKQKRVRQIEMIS